MKKIILSAVIILFAAQMSGQEILDTTILRCKYNYKHILDTFTNKGYSDVMILEIGSKNICSFYCEKISLPIMKIISKYDSEIKKVSRKEFLKIARGFHENPMSVMGEFTVGTGTDKNGNPLPPVKNMPYNPIELE
ncbi:MAG: hypothetical protein LBT56_00665 [Prevotellaceae bacterium]|jgi:hypothetical protein|nr:hypothetical protein [Prevotellaceae bacterium]